MSAATDKTNLAELRRTMTLWHNRVTALGFDGVSDVIALAEAGGDQMKKAWPIGERIALKLMMIKQIGEGSTTANSLPHVARIADEALECIRQHRAAQATPEPVGEVVASEFFAFDPEGGHAFYKTQREAIDHAKEGLKYYRDGANDHGEWDEDVEQIRWGVVMQRAKETNVSATEDGESSCDYALQDVATRPAPGVPDGFVLVPVEPTQAMLDALHSSAYLPGCYRAMLDAAQAKGGQA